MSPTLLGATLAAFGTYWVVAIAVNWFPAVLEARGLSPLRSAIVLTIAWAAQIPVFAIAAWASMELRKRGHKREVAFGAPVALGVILSGASLLAMSANPAAPGLCIFATLCLASTALAITCLPPMVDDVSPPSRRGTTMNSFVAVASVAGFLAPAAFGFMTDLTRAGSGFGTALEVSGIVVILLAPAALLLMRPTRDCVPDDTVAEPPA